MKFSIDPKIFFSYPTLKVGAILLKGIDNSRRVSAVEGLLRGVCAQRQKEFANKEITEHPLIQVWDSAYGNFGVNPKKNPPSIHALLKRLKAGKEIPHISTLVDIYNYFSLKYLLPIGGEDMDWLCGDLRLAYTFGDEHFRPIGSIEVETAKEGEVAYMDKGGITCRFWNHRECERTKFTNKTVNALILVEDLSNIHMDKFGQLLDEMRLAFAKYMGGMIEIHILNEENIEIDLGITGRKTADDSKIPPQEKAHFLEVQAKTKIKEEAKKTVEEKPVKKTKKADQKGQLTLLNEEEKVVLNLSDNSLLKGKIKQIIEIAITKAFPQTPAIPVKLEYPSSSEHGDYATNIALPLAKILGMKPQEIASKIAENILSPELIEKVEIAGPGFINIFISEKALTEEVEKAVREKDKYGTSNVGKEKTIVMDYSAPNIAKPLGVHHLLSTIIGQCNYNLFQNLGFKCVSVNHIGDWGTQFGKLIYAYKKWGSKELISKDPINELLKLYVKFHDEAEKAPEIEDSARHEFKIFEEGDKENRELWKWFVDESLKEIEKTYKHLGGIHFDQVMGESFYEDKMEEILEDGKVRGVFVKGEEGAYVVMYDDPHIAPFVVQKKDGATLYSTRDLATLKYRIDTWHPVKILYVVDGAQSMHFKQLFTAAERFPWYHGEGEHISFGRMRMKDGKMSTRKGNVILLDDVLSEGEKRALKVVEEKNPDLKDKEKVATAVGIGAIKYNVLSQNRSTDILFDWDKMLSIDGNSAPYLQYTYARARSIIRKTKNIKLKKAETEEKSITKDKDVIKAKTRELMKLIPQFPEAINLAAEGYKPNLLCNYLYGLAQAFNSFYNVVPVLRANNVTERRWRLKLVHAVSQILKNGLGILGIGVMEEM